MPGRKRTEPRGEPEYWSAQEVAAKLNLTPEAIYYFIDRNELAAYRFGSAVRIKKVDFEKYLEKCKVKHVGRPLKRYGEEHETAS
jgi:excisionase family DNA binding protein